MSDSHTKNLYLSYIHPHTSISKVSAISVSIPLSLRKAIVSLQRNIPQERNADGNPSPWKALWRNSGNGLYYMRNYIQTDTVRISAIYLRTGGTPEIAHYATEWMVTVIPFITSSGEVGKKRGFTSKLGYLYPSSSHNLLSIVFSSSFVMKCTGLSIYYAQRIQLIVPFVF